MKRTKNRQEYKATSDDLRPRSLREIRKPDVISDSKDTVVVHRTKAPLTDHESEEAKSQAVDFLSCGPVRKKLASPRKLSNGVSKQRRRQLELRASGLCQSCASPRKDADKTPRSDFYSFTLFHLQFQIPYI